MRSSSLLKTLLLLSLTACAPDVQGQFDNDDRQDNADARTIQLPNFGLTGDALETELSALLNRAVAESFDAVAPLLAHDESLFGVTSGFCKSVGTVEDINNISTDELDANAGIHLPTAQRLAYLSTLEYASPFYMAEVAENMGFGDPGDGLKWRKLIALEAQLFVEAIADRTSEKSLEIQQNMVLRRAYEDEKIQFFSVGSTQVMWAEHPTENMAVLIFRGTEPTKFRDILTDADLRAVSLRGWGTVHQGFLDGWEAKQPDQMPNVNLRRPDGSIIDLTSNVSAKELILQKLANVARRDDYRIWVSGHSLGGALAAVATTTIIDTIENGVVINGSIVDGQYNTAGVTTSCENADSGDPCVFMPKYRVAGLYDFGQPRVGLQDMVAGLHAAANGTTAGSDGEHGTADDQAGGSAFPYVRFQNRADLVTLIPTSDIVGIADYRHAGQCVHLVDASNDEDAFDNLGTFDLRTDFTTGSVEHHAMDAFYYPLLKQFAASSVASARCND